MYSAKKSHPAPVGNSPCKLSPYKKGGAASDRVADDMDSRTPSSKPISANQSRFLEIDSNAKPVPQLNPPQTKTRDQVIKPITRKPPPVCNPKISDSLFGLNRHTTTSQQTTSCPSPIISDQPNLSHKSIKHKPSTSSLKKHNPFNLNAKEAFDRFIKSAKRNLTLDSSSSKPNHPSNKSKLKSRPTVTNKLMISYPKRIHTPDFDFIKTPRYEIQEIKPKVELRRCSSTTSTTLNSKLKPYLLHRQNPTTTSPTPAIKRSQTCGRRVLNLNHFSPSNCKSKLEIVDPITHPNPFPKLGSIPENEVIPKHTSFPTETQKSQDELTLCGTDPKSYDPKLSSELQEQQDREYSAQLSPPIEEIGLAMLPEDNTEKDLPSRRSIQVQDSDEKFSRRNSMKKDARNDASEGLQKVSSSWKAFHDSNSIKDSPNPLSIPLPSTPPSRFSMLESAIHSLSPTTKHPSKTYFKTKIIEKSTYTPHSRSPFLKKHTTNLFDHSKHEDELKKKNGSGSNGARDSGGSNYSQTSASVHHEDTIQEDISLTLMGCGSSYTPYNLQRFYSNMSSNHCHPTTHFNSPALGSDHEKELNRSEVEEKGKLNQDGEKESKVDVQIKEEVRIEKEKETQKEIEIENLKSKSSKKKSFNRLSNLLSLEKSEIDYKSDWYFDLIKSLSKVKV
ncbi:uncharacterized protein MELLADRAFT_87424 [Melampsora larici-populina 98AG31]|uniref:Uncharacterized protein n=1 Tax=Melampsora larici-populina (strain 98AG31 / pathotype 3-4-7) TaxID=747676 RepID=F4SDV0_MELLP|nr:uncharacterized protein MELLADRAFT_87424 [Melampsora larici-populina 98AG31]EGF97176.1 hypothetical protein MELLADRAFT_87424 [Melampsora larici-populina 98AG31]